MKKDGRLPVSELLSADLSCQYSEATIRYDSRLYTLSELSKSACETVLAMIENGLTPSEALAELSEGILPINTESCSKSLLGENPRQLLRAIALCDRIAFTELLLKNVSERGYPISLADFFADEETGDTVTYLRGALADEAFDLFSEYLPNATVAYSESIREGAQALTDGRVAFFIVPIEEKGGVRIPTVSSIINRLSLKIVAVTPVYGVMGDAEMKYALLANSFINHTLAPDDDLYIELSLASISALTEVLFALEGFSHEIYKLFSLEDLGNGERITLIIRVNPDTVALFISYLTVFIRDFSLVGIYKNLE